MRQNRTVAWKGKRLRMDRIWPYLFVLPYLLCYFLFNFYPTLYSFYISFFDWNGISDKVFVGLQNYITLLTKDALFWKAMRNTLLMIAISIPVQIGLGLVAAAILFGVATGAMLYYALPTFSDIWNNVNFIGGNADAYFSYLGILLITFAVSCFPCFLIGRKQNKT